MSYHVTAFWQETRELDFDSLDEASEWARKLLADEPQAGIQVSAEDFIGSWFTPTPAKQSATSVSMSP